MEKLLSNVPQNGRIFSEFLTISNSSMGFNHFVSLEICQKLFDEAFSKTIKWTPKIDDDGALLTIDIFKKRVQRDEFEFESFKANVGNYDSDECDLGSHVEYDFIDVSTGKVKAFPDVLAPYSEPKVTVIMVEFDKV